MPNLTGYTAGSLPRETASVDLPRELAAEGDRTFTEAEHLAVAASMVASETASLKEKLEVAEAKLATSEAEKAAVAEKLAVAEAEKATAEAELAKIVEEAEKAARLETLATEREAEIRKVAAHLPEDYFTPEKAADWAAMEEPAFDSLSSALAATAPKGAPVAETASTTTIVGAPASAPAKATGAAATRSFLRLGK